MTKLAPLPIDDALPGLMTALAARPFAVLVAPLASVRTRYPTRVPVEFLNDRRFVVLDQITSVDKTRLVKKIGEVDVPTRGRIVEILAELFAE